MVSEITQMTIDTTPVKSAASIIAIELVQTFQWPDMITFSIQSVIGLLTIFYLTLKIKEKLKK